MASIIKLPSGAYRVQIRRKGRYASETFLRRDDAHRWARQAETRVDQGLAPNKSSVSRLTGLQRTWLDPATADKAPVSPPRKAMGNLLGHGVRIGKPVSVLAAGEGLETMFSLHLALPELPAVAALSANHLAALQLPADLRRLYIAVDTDPAGLSAADQLAHRAIGAGIDAVHLSPRLGDFNDDLRANGRDALSADLRPQLAPEDAVAFLDHVID